VLSMHREARAEQRPPDGFERHRAPLWWPPARTDPTSPPLGDASDAGVLSDTVPRSDRSL
jgi:hypothetical protein